MVIKNILGDYMLIMNLLLKTTILMELRTLGDSYKVRIAKFRGGHKHTFYLHIKEYEFRYNYRNKNLYLILLRNFRNPIKLS